MSNSILMQTAKWPPGERGQTNDEVAPPVDLLQMLIAPATGASNQLGPQGPTEPEVHDSTSGYSSLTTAVTGGRHASPLPINLTRISGCYTTCRACAEERYVRQQQRHRSDVRLTKSSTCGRCPTQNKPSSIDDRAPGTSGPVYLNYFRCANGPTTGAGSSGTDDACNSPANDTWPSIRRSRLWLPKTTRGISSSLPRFGGNGRRQASTTATSAAKQDYDFEDKDDYFDDNAIDVRRRNAKRSHLESNGFVDGLMSSASSLCCRMNHRSPWCRTSTNNASVRVGGAAGEPLDPKTASIEEDSSSVRWCRQDGPEVVTTPASSKVGRSRSVKTSTSAEDGRTRQHHRTSLPRHRRQTLFAVGFLVGLFIIASSLLTGFVILWPPASLYGERRRPVTDIPETGRSDGEG